MSRHNGEVIERLKRIEHKLDRIESKVDDMHAHVGFVNDLSGVFARWKTKSYSVVDSAYRFIGLSQESTTDGKHSSSPGE